MDVDSYLERIGLDPGDVAGRDADRALLAALQERHMRTVPLENIDIVRGVPIVLERERLYEKIVEDERGGFCYELTGLFSWLLAELGFETTLVSGRVARPGGGLGPPFDHVTTIVHLDRDRDRDRDRGRGRGRDYLVDVGYGEFTRKPLPFTGEQVSDVNATYRVVPTEQRDARDREFGVVESDDGWQAYWTERRKRGREYADGEWEPAFRFTTEPRTLDEFAEACEHHQTATESPFTGDLICTRATESGRVTLSADNLTITRRGEKEKRSIDSGAARAAYLDEYFGISVDLEDDG